MTQKIDPKILELIPHRPPMLLIHELVNVDQKASCSKVFINQNLSFFRPGLGVPSWIGLEYMGQTAALIAGYQTQQGILGKHNGFLLGSRFYKSTCEYFEEGSILMVSCTEKVVVGDELASFDCIIDSVDAQSNILETLATASLTVVRKANF